MDNTIDTLQIEIESSTTDAQRGLTKLKNSLQKLTEMSNAVANMNSDGISKLKEMAQGVESLANAGSNPGLSAAVSELRKLSKIDFSNLGAGSEKISEIADKVGAYLMVDMAHIAGLVAAGVHPSPVPYADIVTTTTHKTLRGPRGGMILCKEQFAKQIDKAVFPGTQGGPLMHIIAAKAVALGEALTEEFKNYQKQVVKNAAVLADELMKHGIDIVSGGTDNHLMLLDLRNKGITGKELEHRLDEVRITANKNTIPNDPQSPFVTSGLRIGTPAVTTRASRSLKWSLSQVG